MPKASKSNFGVSHSILPYNNPINQFHIIDILHYTVKREKLNFVYYNQTVISFRLQSDWHLSHPMNKVSVIDKVPETKRSRCAVAYLGIFFGGGGEVSNKFS